jgi:hypothetical protein
MNPRGILAGQTGGQGQVELPTFRFSIGESGSRVHSPRVSHARFACGSFFVPKPSTDADCQRRSIPGLGQTARRCPLASTAVRGDCHSLCHSAVREPVVSGCCPTRFPSLWTCARGRSTWSVTWSCGLVRSSANALEPRRMRPELRPARPHVPNGFQEDARFAVHHGSYLDV